MNKYIWRTSLVWLFLVAGAIGVMRYRSGVHAAPKDEQRESEPVAQGPAAGSLAPATDVHASDAQLVPIQLSPERMQSIGVKTGTVEYQQLSDDIRATGTVAIDESRVSYVQNRFPGYIREVFANATFMQVRKGQPLFTVYSPDLVQTQREFLLAEQDEKAMSGSGVEGVASGSASLVHAAEERLRQWDISDADIERLRKTGKPISEITVNAPVSGFVTERNALPNLYAEPSTRLYTIVDLSRVWIDAQVFQDDIGRVRPGEAAEVTMDAYPGQVLHAAVQSILAASGSGDAHGGGAVVRGQSRIEVEAGHVCECFAQSNPRQTTRRSCFRGYRVGASPHCISRPGRWASRTERDPGWRARWRDARGDERA